MNTNTVIFAGGCFWCVEHDLKEAEGVTSVVSGYASHHPALSGTPPRAGGEKMPTYMDHEGYREAVQVSYDSTKTNFTKLVQFFLDHIDPTDTGGQFGDRGTSYQTAIFYHTEEEKKIAESLLYELDDSHVYDKPHAVEVLPATTFYKAEEYHQDYAEKNPEHYARYRTGSGREDFVNRTCAIREEKHILWKE
jgi:peptide methionine sulfoxide reductase msrA/msrB